MSPVWIVFPVALIVFGIIIVFWIWYFRTADAHVERWAGENGYQLVLKEHRFLRRGPFFWSTSRNQAIFYVEVIDSQGGQRKGWVRLGSWWWGVLKYQVEVRWEQDSGQAG